MVEVKWGSHGCRMGWWVYDGENLPTYAIMGPSICETSGGGPMRVLEVLRSTTSIVGDVSIVIPEHTNVSGENCLCGVLSGVVLACLEVRNV